MLGKLKDMVRSRDGSEWVISFTTASDFREAFDELFGKVLSIEIKPFSKKRSLDSNAYAWVLINKIAAKLQEKEPKSGWTPLEVYRNAIREVPDVCSIHCMPNDQVEGFVKDWESLGDGFQVELFPSKIEGCTNGKFWKGSHMYNSLQMNKLINILVLQAEENGIPTITEKELQSMIGDWAKKRKENGNAPKDDSA